MEITRIIAMNEKYELPVNHVPPEPAIRKLLLEKMK